MVAPIFQLATLTDVGRYLFRKVEFWYSYWLSSGVDEEDFAVTFERSHIVIAGIEEMTSARRFLKG